METSYLNKCFHLKRNALKKNLKKISEGNYRHRKRLKKVRKKSY